MDEDYSGWWLPDDHDEVKQNALSPARFTREDVEKAAAEVFKITWKRECYNGVALRDIDRYRNNGPDSMGGRVERYEAESVEIATAALSAIGDVDHG